MILVTGGAGYIGSHMCKLLREKRVDHVVFDNLERGHERATGRSPIFFGDLRDRTSIDRLFTEFDIDAVLHFAAYIEVGESVRKPSQYYRNNVGGTLNLLEAMIRANVRKIVFSSTASVYGAPETDLITEDHPKSPTNPYGRSKLMVETMIQDFVEAYGLRSVCLRYFNAAGADPEGRIGEDHRPETHIVPNVLMAAAGKRDTIRLYGTDYDTPDGTCVRDYVHVMDLCSAHMLALGRLEEADGFKAYNLGSGDGKSVRQVIQTAEKVTGRSVAVEEVERRPGDPPRLVASSDLARSELGWKPMYPDLKDMVAHAWHWMQEFPGGYDH